MLHQELPHIESSPLDGWGSWIAPAVVAGASLTAALVLFLIGQATLAAAAVLLALVAGGLTYWRGVRVQPVREPIVSGPDYSLVGSALGMCAEAAALTSEDGSLLIANAAYRERFGGSQPPLQLGVDAEAGQGLEIARTMAWRDGAGCAARVRTATGQAAVEVERVGANGDLLLWRFPLPAPPDPLTVAAKWLSGSTGEKLGAAGILAALVGEDGMVIAGNRLFCERALSDPAHLAERFASLVDIGEDGQVRLTAEGESARPMRLVHVPVDPKKSGKSGTFLLFERSEAMGTTDGAHLQALLDVLPIGLALVDRDGRFLTMNEAFRTAAGIGGSASPV